MSKQRLQQKQYQNLSPQQIQFLGLLQIPISTLEKRIEEELEENPALEEEEDFEEKKTDFSYNKPDFSDYQIEDNSENLSDYILKQLIGADIPPEKLFLVKYLINSLDDNGFLNRDLFAVASDLLINSNLDVSESELLAALHILQDLEPIGIGAQNLQECLLIQLRILHPERLLLQTIIKDYYTSFSNKNFEYLIKKLEIDSNQLKKAYSIIESLNPIPGNGFSKNSTNIEYIYPDFSIILNNNQLNLQLNKSNAKPIKISKYYSALLKDTSDKETKYFLKKKIEKAQWFKDALAKREETLKKVMTAIIGLQESYFLSGSEKDLTPMKLANVAQIVTMDISTISRVSNSKYVETHFGTFKLKELFSDAYRKDNGEVISTKEIKSHLQEIIDSENKSKPFTDEQLSELLGKDEYHIARRTVAKYRENLGVETAKLRREL